METLFSPIKEKEIRNLMKLTATSEKEKKYLNYIRKTK